MKDKHRYVCRRCGVPVSYDTQARMWVHKPRKTTCGKPAAPIGVEKRKELRDEA